MAYRDIVMVKKGSNKMTARIQRFHCCTCQEVQTWQVEFGHSYFTCGGSGSWVSSWDEMTDI